MCCKLCTYSTSDKKVVFSVALFAIALQSLIEEDISIQQLPTAFIFSSACSAFEHKKEFTQLQITSKMCLKC